jgi:phospholipid/cholesterol/gamma-HCH transport system substrate-binding protein
VKLTKALRLYIWHVLTLAGIIVIALVVSGYIATHERLRFPWEHVRTLYAEFSNAQAVTPGQGQTINVAGVEVGEIGEVRLENGVAVVRMDLKSSDLGPVYRNAHLLLRPKTGLNDMSISMDPGTPDPSLPGKGELKDGDRLPVENTLPAVNSDEVLAALDTDTRNYLATLTTAGGQGLRHRAGTLRRVIAASEPTAATATRVMRAIADRRAKVARLVTNLHLLARAAASKDRDLASLVDGTTASFRTIADREADLGAAVDRLPGALDATDRALTATGDLSNELLPTLTALRPTVRQLAPDLVAVRPLLRRATPTLRYDVRPLVREATPLVHQLRPSLALLNQSSPDLQTSVDVLNRVVNILAYNPPGAEEGYLFWTAWFFHNAASILSVQDAHGATWRGLVMVGCSSIGEVLAANPALKPLGAAAFCPGGGGLPLPKKGRATGAQVHDAKAGG